ncbi:hypothetical protein QR680_010304 [Steinernema hermaphroditum]|uniref:Peptidase M13 C-terminal domain-containing protein n=1 Tax=Steinernema hermaphroditum TaxID=289476 RepID=A0AA39IPQ7_9BILA|nr:hypothetical protein QR680_010304 [Steinernema hermaphroditum]
MAAKAFLLLFLFVIGELGYTEQFNIESGFDRTFHPCEDIFRHVCTKNAEMEKFSEMATYGLLHDIVRVLYEKNKKIEDPMYSKIWRAIKKESHLTETDKKKCRFKGIDVSEDDFDKRSDFKIGKAFGQMAAYGRVGDDDRMRIIYDEDEDTSTLYIVEDNSKTRKISKNSFEKIQNAFVQGILSGFVAEIPELLNKLRRNKMKFVYRDLDPMDYKDIILRPTHWESETADINTLVTKNSGNSFDDVYERFHFIFWKEQFAGYGNVLLAHTLYSNEQALNPGVAKNLIALKNRILKEIEKNVKNSYWMSPTDRRNVVAYLKDNNVVIGIDEKYQDLTLLTNMMDAYREEFEKVDDSEECLLEMYSRAHGLARHRLIYSGTGSVNTFLNMYHQEDTLLQNNAYHIGNSIYIYPGAVHILNNYNLPTGAKYGYIGFTIGHEVFHGLGITDERAEIFNHLEGLVETDAYKRTQQCYLDFYGEKQFCKSENQCPKAENKIDEGFADVEGARVLFSLLQQALKENSPEQRKKRVANETEKLPLFDWRAPGVAAREILMSDSDGLSEEQWFFIGLLFDQCDQDPNNEADIMDTDEHPRAQIRMNAVVQQMTQFTNIFKCRKDEDNYVSDNQCVLYAPVPPRTDASAVVSTGLVFLFVAFMCFL